MNQCPKCHKLLSGNFCPDCGVKAETICQCPTSIDCPKCHSRIWNNYGKIDGIPKFCEKCGYEIIGNTIKVIKSDFFDSYYIANGALLLVEGNGSSQFYGNRGYRIPNDVICICNRAFQNCSFSISSIYIPKTVKYIQCAAFDGKKYDGDTTYPKNLHYEGTKKEFLGILEIPDYGATAANFITYNYDNYIYCSDGRMYGLEFKREISRLTSK